MPIEEKGSVIVKHGVPRLMRIEMEKMSRAFAIGRNTGLFRVPEVLGYDDLTGELTIERIHGLVGVRRALMTDSQMEAFAARAGASLAAIHRELQLPPELRHSLPAPWSENCATAFLHGDFSTENVCVDPADPGVPVIIDWQTTKRHGGEATFDTSYFDVVWFISNLFYKVPFRLRAKHDCAVAASFFESYALASRCMDHSAFHKYHRRFYVEKVRARMSTMSFPMRVVFSRGQSMWDSFIRSQAGGANGLV